jgi:hypothetical protein
MNQILRWLRVFLLRLWLLLSVGLCVGCNSAVDLPANERQANWGREDNGSCVWACLTTLLRAQGDPRAEALRMSHSGGAELIWVCGGKVLRDDAAAALKKLGIRYHETFWSDEAFLQTASERGPGAAVLVNDGSHCVILVLIDSDRVELLDPNFPRKFYFVPRKTFLAEWRRSGGWAIRPLQWWEIE